MEENKNKLNILLDKLNLSNNDKEQWCNVLCKYDFLLIEKKINTYLMQSKEPKLSDIVYGLEATHLMPDRRNYKEPCNICDKMFDYDKINKHESRCSSIRFLIKKTKDLLQKEIPNDFIQKLWDMNEKEFDQFYCKMIQKYMPLESNNFQKELYQQILVTKE